MTLTSPERVLWPDAGFTKRDAAGRGGFRTRRVAGRRGKPQDYCLVESLDDLLRLVNMGGLELHPLLSRGADVDRATHLFFDLDPGPPADVLDCVAVALAIRAELPGALVKTSGSLGLHVTVPLEEPAPFDETKAAARTLARRLAGPRVTDRADRSARAGKVFVDWNQNDRTKSIVSAFSLRALPFPTVSTPLGWEELEATGAARDLCLPRARRARAAQPAVVVAAVSRPSEGVTLQVASRGAVRGSTSTRPADVTARTAVPPARQT